MRILIADDHPLVRQGLKQILADELPEAEFAEAQTTAEALAQLWQQSFDAIVLDLNMPGRSGFEVLQEVARHHPKLPVLVLTAYPESQLGMRALKAGAAGYLNKQSAPEELVAAIRKITTGGRYISPALAEALAGQLSNGAATPGYEQLSAREFEVMGMLVAGQSLKEIAAELSLSVKTVSTFRTRLLQKLGVHNNVELAHYAAIHGLSAAPPRA